MFSLPPPRHISTLPKRDRLGVWPDRQLFGPQRTRDAGSKPRRLAREAVASAERRVCTPARGRRANQLIDFR